MSIFAYPNVLLANRSSYHLRDVMSNEVLVADKCDPMSNFLHYCIAETGLLISRGKDLRLWNGEEEVLVDVFPPITALLTASFVSGASLNVRLPFLSIRFLLFCFVEGFFNCIADVSP